MKNDNLLKLLVLGALFAATSLEAARRAGHKREREDTDSQGPVAPAPTEVFTGQQSPPIDPAVELQRPPISRILQVIDPAVELQRSTISRILRECEAELRDRSGDDLDYALLARIRALEARNRMINTENEGKILSQEASTLLTKITDLTPADSSGGIYIFATEPDDESDESDESTAQ